MKKSTLLFLSVLIVISSCEKNKDLEGINFRSEMVKFTGEISSYSKSMKPGFIIIPQNGEALAKENAYLDNIDAVGIEDLSYGYDGDGVATSDGVKNEKLIYLNMFKALNKPVLITDYVFANSEDVPHFEGATKNKIDNAYQYCLQNGFIPYTTVRNLNYLTLNPGHEPAIDTITNFNQSKSFLYYLQPNGISKAEYIDAISKTNFDVVIMDMTYDGSDEWTADDILKIKEGLNNGNGGFVVCYMSIGEAEDYRYYFKKEWTSPDLFDAGSSTTGKAPNWLESENKDWYGNFMVRYWEKEWKNIVFGSNDSYLDKIISKGFDGVYLDIVDAYEYFEDKMKK